MHMTVDDLTILCVSRKLEHRISNALIIKNRGKRDDPVARSFSRRPESNSRHMPLCSWLPVALAPGG